MSPSNKASSNTKDDSTNSLPAVLQFWKGLNDGLPSLSLPLGPSGQPLSFTVSILSAIVLATINLLARQLLVHVAGFPEGAKITKDTAASFSGVFHSTNLLVGLAYLFATQKYAPSSKMSTASAGWQKACDAVISFCIGYMMYDAIFIVLTAQQEGTGLTADDMVFLAHHFMTTTYMMQTRILGKQVMIVCAIRIIIISIMANIIDRTSLVSSDTLLVLF